MDRRVRRFDVDLARGLAVFCVAVGVALGVACSAKADMASLDSRRPLAAAPPMGFNNWARFQCAAQAPLHGRDRTGYGFQDFMLDQAKALVSTGLARAGYRTVVVDDCWMERGPEGALRGISRWGSYKHPSGQPKFDPDLSAYVASLHDLGLMAGLYNTSGKTTCQGVAAGEEGHQADDAVRFARWGVDFLKLDNCGASDEALPGLFRQMSAALGAADAAGGRPILFDESAPAQYALADPMKYQAMDWVRPLGQMWRVAPDIRITHIGPEAGSGGGRSIYDPWSFNDAAQGYEEGVYQAYTDTVALARYVGPGNWNDADQLLIGDDGLTTAEERSQMGLWSIMGAPLIISSDIRVLAAHPSDPHYAASLDILRNARAIAIDQDPLGAGGYRVLRDSSADDVGVDVVVKPLADGGFAFLVLNKAPISRTYAIALSKLGVAPVDCALELTNVWTGETSVVKANSDVSAAIGPHDNAMIRVAPAACMTLTPTGQIAAAQAEFASPPLCLQSDEAGAITVESCSNGPRQQWRMEPDGHIRQAQTQMCLAPDDQKAVRLAACATKAQQRFRYRRSGALTLDTGSCLAVATGKVGAGGLIGQQGAKIGLADCTPFAPEQAFSAPWRGAPD